MYYQTVLEKAESLLRPIVEELGYEVVEITFAKVGSDDHLTFFIHKKGGITLADCERVNDALDEPLERLDITEGRAYMLNVSSPGLDRPIVTDRDIERNLDTEVDAFLLQPVQKKQTLTGVLKGYDAESVRIVVKGKPTTVARSNIKKMLPHIKF